MTPRLVPRVGAPGLDFETWETTTRQVQIHAVRDLGSALVSAL